MIHINEHGLLLVYIQGKLCWKLWFWY